MNKLFTPTHTILPLTHKARAHKPAVETNVQETWKIFGWQPSKPVQQRRAS